jgi:hypothetical protein
MSDYSNITSVGHESDQGDIFSRIVSIIEEARSTVIRTVKYKGHMNCDLFIKLFIYSPWGQHE